MKRIIETKFYTFKQNNSGGYFIENDDVAHYLIIETQDSDEAIKKMKEITKDYSAFCSCCGERWKDYMDESDGKNKPMIDDEDAYIYIGHLKSSTIIYYYNGIKEKLRYEVC